MARETGGMKEAQEYYPKAHMTLIAEETGNHRSVNSIEVIPAWKYLLQSVPATRPTSD